MNRLQKKCFVASISMHALLLVIVLFGSAFASLFEPDRPIINRVPHVYSASAVEAALSTGGDAMARPAPAPVAPPPVIQQPKPVVPPQPAPQAHPVKTQIPTIAPPKITPVARTVTLPPKPQKVERAPEPKPVEWDEPVRKPAKSVAKLDANDLKPVKQTQAETQKAKQAAEEAAQARAVARAAAQRRAAFNQAMNDFNNKLTPAAMVRSTPGPGGDGPLATNYRDLIATKYTDAWIPPPGMTDESATVLVSVTIGRDGHVISSHIIRTSGNISMDNSIRLTIENVTYIAPFPEGIAGPEMTVEIAFDLKAKRLNG